MYIVVFITVSKKQEAEVISRGLIKNRLAACVNMVRGIDSLFWWKGGVDRAREILLIAKTRRSKFKKLAAFVKSVHSYTVPEIIALPVVSGNKGYLAWINESVG
ncbi:MAG: divalent-cation tolerance protein CutA [Candidatus Omnitrophica bacterium]|nr:divalent-cation tolerance protein CutA [Candidatus Omnitrophota bacterium]